MTHEDATDKQATELEHRYQQERDAAQSPVQPPAALDARILQMARDQAEHTRQRHEAITPFSHGRMAQLSIAASVLLAVSVVIVLQDEAPQELSMDEQIASQLLPAPESTLESTQGLTSQSSRVVGDSMGITTPAVTPDTRSAPTETVTQSLSRSRPPVETKAMQEFAANAPASPEAPAMDAPLIMEPGMETRMEAGMESRTETRVENGAETRTRAPVAARTAPQKQHQQRKLSRLAVTAHRLPSPVTLPELEIPGASFLRVRQQLVQTLNSASPDNFLAHLPHPYRSQYRDHFTPLKNWSAWRQHWLQQPIIGYLQRGKDLTLILASQFNDPTRQQSSLTLQISDTQHWNIIPNDRALLDHLSQMRGETP